MYVNPFAALAAAALGLSSCVPPASAQQYPNRTVTIIVPYPAGGPTDETARVVAQSLSAQAQTKLYCRKRQRRQHYHRHRKGRAGDARRLHAAVHNLQISANVTLYKNLPFDTVKDLFPVMLINVIH